MSYAEAVKKVEEDGSRGRDPERSGVSSRSVPVPRDRATSDKCVRDLTSEELQGVLSNGGPSIQAVGLK